MSVMEVMALARLLCAGILAATGFALIAGAMMGVLRFPDVYARAHGAAVSHGLGAALVLAGLAVEAPDWSAAARLIMLSLLVFLLGPLLAHFVVNAAHAAGLAPVTGRYSPPRPGAAKPLSEGG